jgi:hypothetical protein
VGASKRRELERGPRSGRAAVRLGHRRCAVHDARPAGVLIAFLAEHGGRCHCEVPPECPVRVRNAPNCLGCRPRRVPPSKGSGLCHYVDLCIISSRFCPPARISHSRPLGTRWPRRRAKTATNYVASRTISGKFGFDPVFRTNLSIHRLHSLDSLYDACMGPRAINGVPSTSK